MEWTLDTLMGNLLELEPRTDLNDFSIGIALGNEEMTRQRSSIGLII